MTDRLLKWYNRELAFIRNEGAEFAKANPAIAGNLRMSGDHVEDPHVSRMIEAFAYLNARTRQKLEDGFPEITEAFLGILYPHYLAPIPSAAIARFRLDATQFELTQPHLLPPKTSIETAPTALDGQPCRFRTCYPVPLLPLNVSAASFHKYPTPAPKTRFSQGSKAVIRIQLDLYKSASQMQNLRPGSLRFFLNGQDQHVYALYEALFTDAIGVAIAPSHDAENPIELGSDVIHPVGFGRDEGLLDYSARSFLGYRLLTEFFAFPEKYLFVDISGLDERVMKKLGTTSHAELFIYLKKNRDELERNVGNETFQLGCTPIVNLFSQVADPFKVNHRVSEYRVIPDPRRPQSHEVFSIDRIEAVPPRGEKRTFAPFYSVKHARRGEESAAFWYAARRPAGYKNGEYDAGTELFLSLVDLDFTPMDLQEWTVEVHTTCLNRDLPSRLPFDGSLPMQLSDGGAIVAGNQASCITAPTATCRPSGSDTTLWRLISHLSLNHLSLTNDMEGASALKEMLTLYNFQDSADSRQMIEGLVGVKSEASTGRVPSARGNGHGICRGTRVTLQLDEEKFNLGNAYLFSTVMDRFLGLYSSINSFTRTFVRTIQREDFLYQGKPRASERTLEATDTRR